MSLKIVVGRVETPRTNFVSDGYMLNIAKRKVASQRRGAGKEGAELFAQRAAYGIRRQNWYGVK